MTRRWLIGLFVLVSTLVLIWTTLPPKEEKVRPREIAFLRTESSWADSVLLTLSLNEKLTQLLFLSQRKEESEQVADLSLSLQPGGIIWQGYSTKALSACIQNVQAARSLPIMMGVRYDNRSADLLQAGPAPKLAALPDDDLIQPYGLAMAEQLAGAGIQLQLIPSLSGYYTSETYRTYVDRVSKLGQTLEDKRILTCMEEVTPFVPILGDSSLRDSFLRPYRRLHARGISSWQLGPRPEPVYKGYPPPLSALRNNRLGFKGLVFAKVPEDPRDLSVAVQTLIRQGAQYFEVSAAQLEEMPAVLMDLLRRGEISLEEVNQRVYRLLLAKSWAMDRAFEKSTAPRDSLERNFLRYQYAHQTLVLARNPDRNLPIRLKRGDNPYILDLGEPTPHLLASMQLYGPVGHRLREKNRKGKWEELPFRSLRYANPLIVTFKGLTREELSDTSLQASLAALQTHHNLIGLNFLADSLLPLLPKQIPLLQLFEEDSLTQTLAGQVIWGGLSPDGHLPRTLSPELLYGTNLPFSPTRLAYASPLAGGFAPEKLSLLDTLVQESIEAHAMPGCQLLVAHKGKIVWDKAYGYHTYARRRAVSSEDVYDLASMTKVLATTLACMYMQDQGRLKPDTRLRDIFKNRMARLDTAFVDDSLWQMIAPNLAASLESDSPETQGGTLTPVDSSGQVPDSQLVIHRRAIGSALIASPVFDLTLGELLCHHSGLPPNMPVLPYLTYRKKGLPRFGTYYQPRPSETYSIPVAHNFFLRNDILDSIWEQTKLLPIDPEKPYRYSDANLVLVQRAIDSLNGYGMDSLLRAFLYDPLRLEHTGFSPREWSRERYIVPTESDQKWRQQLIRGYVHDETAALFGGVSGNAGLFSRASDLAPLLQMLLNEGSYGGKQFLRERTVRSYTRRQAGHRGYGFDLKPLEGPYIGSFQASPNTFGHTGFTGTCFWVDPDEDLIFIFLSNRVHPRRSNWYLSELQVRQRLHDLIYSALLPESTPLP